MRLSLRPLFFIYLTRMYKNESGRRDDHPLTAVISLIIIYMQAENRRLRACGLTVCLMAERFSHSHHNMLQASW